MKRKYDIALIVTILLAAGVISLGIMLHERSSGEGAVAVVTIDGEEYGRYPLSEDAEVMIDQGEGVFNRLIISDGAASVDEASCPDLICVKHMRIRYSGETIVCLPNRVVVEIKGGKDSDIDGSTF